MMMIMETITMMITIMIMMMMIMKMMMMASWTSNLSMDATECFRPLPLATVAWLQSWQWPTTVAALWWRSVAVGAATAAGRGHHGGRHHEN